MQKTKFRVWDEKNNRFNYWGFLEGLAGFYFQSPNFSGMSMEEVQKKSEQCIGIKDINGKEIYEGDCYISNWDIVVNVVTFDIKKEVKTAGQGMLDTITKVGFELDKGLDKIEIVGNIHENFNIIEEEQ